MRKTKPNLLLVLLVGALTVAASAPVAMRVEVQPQRADGDGTLVAVFVQVSPEDRMRIGSNAMVRIELDGDTPPGQSPLWAISLENDGSAEIETTWPPGEHDLRVEIKSSSGKDSGLWVGKVRVPALDGPDAASTTLVQTTVVPEPAPDADRPEATDAVAGAAAATSVPKPATPAPSHSEPVMSSGVSADEGAVSGESPAEPEGIDDELQDKAGAFSDGEPQTVADEATPEEPNFEPQTVEAAPVAESPAPPEPESEIALAATSGVASAARTEAAPSPSVAESEIVSEPATQSEPPPVVEPLRSQEPASAVEPLRSEPAPPTSTALAALPTGPSTEILDAYDEWRDADPDSTDLTVIVMRSRQPVPGLEPDDLELLVGGSRVPVTDLGDSDHAPLSLGLAVDLSDENVGLWGQVSRDLAPLVGRAGGDLGSLFVATSGDTSDWDVDPQRMDEAILTPAGGDLAALIRKSLGRFEDRRGRTFLLVLTDGRIEPSKDAWRETTAAVETAGIPVLVMALWDEGFRKKMRKNLQQITSISGGRLFMLQTLSQMEGAVERFGGVLDAGVALRFESPPAGKNPSQIVVRAPDRTLDITAPKAIR